MRVWLILLLCFSPSLIVSTIIACMCWHRVRADNRDRTLHIAQCRWDDVLRSWQQPTREPTT